MPVDFELLVPPSGRGQLFVSRAVASTVASAKLLPRDIYVWVPDVATPSDGFPVLYLQDGQNLFDARLVPFGTAWEVDRSVSRLVDAGAIAPVIVVGIASTPGRFNDYAPASILDRLGLAARTAVETAWGGAAKSADYARFVIEDLKTFIDDRFPTCPKAEATFVGGSSLGAVAALEILAHYPQRVAGAACLSAHLSLLPVTEREPLPPRFANAVTAAVARFADECLPDAGRHTIWIDRSTLAIDRFYEATHAALARALEKKGFIDGVDFAVRCYPGVGHDEGAWHSRLDDVLTFLFGFVEDARCAAIRG